jgi:hypothetical protein
MTNLTSFSSGVNTSFSSQLNTNMDILNHRYPVIYPLSDVSLTSSTTYSTILSLDLASSINCTGFELDAGFLWNGTSGSGGVEIMGSTILSDASVVEVINAGYTGNNTSITKRFYAYGTPSGKFITNLLLKARRKVETTSATFVGENSSALGTSPENTYLSSKLKYLRGI